MVLMALGGVYVPHGEFKWLAVLEGLLPLRPQDLTRRLGDVLTAPLAQGIEALHALWEDTYALVGKHFPELEPVQKARRWLNRPAERFSPLGWPP